MSWTLTAPGPPARQIFTAGGGLIVQGVGEPGGEPVFGGGAGLACRPAAAGAAGVGEVVVDGGAGAFECALNRFLGGIEHLGDFGGVVAQDVSQDEHGALTWGQQLQGGDEGQGNGFMAGPGAQR